MPPNCAKVWSRDRAKTDVKNYVTWLLLDFTGHSVLEQKAKGAHHNINPCKKRRRSERGSTPAHTNKTLGRCFLGKPFCPEPVYFAARTASILIAIKNPHNFRSKVCRHRLLGVTAD